MKISEIARLLSATVEGNPELEIRRVAKIEDAGEGDLSFLSNPKYARFLALDPRLCGHHRENCYR